MEGRSIFRRDFVSVQNESLRGTILIKSGISQRLWVSLCLILMTSMIAFLSYGTYSRKVHLEGIVVSSNGVIKLSPSSQGNIEEILVTEGSYVSKGETLFVINHDRYDRNGRDITEKII
uniref:biotin/lipoyl-binding protein n=1 Tax=Thaumasiovibrio subtropicus TaxID=1891207 RepID=UPI00131AE136